MGHSDESVTREVRNRLEDLFGESDDTTPPTNVSDMPDEDLLTDLKSIILSIDWEITDEVMGRFIDETKGLKDNFKNDRVLVLFLQILSSLGKYIRSNKGKTHPSAFKILNSAFRCLEKILLTKSITETEKKKLLLVEVNRFKELKELVGARRETIVKKDLQDLPEAADSKPVSQRIVVDDKRIRADEQTVTDNAAAQYPDILLAIEEIKEFIRSEIELLRKEIIELKQM